MKRPWTARWSAAALGGALLLAGCSFFSKTKNATYSLDTLPGTAVANVQGTPVGIEVLQLPPGIDRREIVVRKADQQLDVRGTDLWQASLERLVLHALAFDLASRLPEGMMILPGAEKPTAAMRSIDVMFEELAAGPNNAITVDARWVIRQSGRPDVSHHERFTTDIASLDSKNIATGHGQAIAALADRIVDGLKPVPTSP